MATRHHQPSPEHADHEDTPAERKSGNSYLTLSFELAADFLVLYK